MLDQKSAQQSIIQDSDSSHEIKRDRLGRIKVKKYIPTTEEVAILESYFEQDPKWSTRTVREVAKQLKMSMKKVYKWGFDKKRRSKVIYHKIKSK